MFFRSALFHLPFQEVLLLAVVRHQGDLLLRWIRIILCSIVFSITAFPA